MTTSLQLIDGDGGESPNDVVARRIRQELAAQKRPMPQTKIAARIGMKQQALSRRMLGEVPFNLNEIYAVCEAAGLDTFYVLTGRRETPRPGGPNEGLPMDVRPERLELPTFWSVPDDLSTCEEIVIPLAVPAAHHSAGAAASEGGRGMISAPGNGSNSADIYGVDSYVISARERCAA
ncbi:helix-turn-helix transcriptional regulator [Amycolatopsis sp. NPDC051716]|uniref:helix-turn-helix transcriptional regulator n=1 Tax=Actinomycetes TaxID=1760 RepID=UPI003428F7F7